MSAKSDFEKLIKKLLRYAKSVGIKYVVTSKGRSREKQSQLYASDNRFPVAAPGKSQHQYGLAWDISFDLDNNAVFGQFWREAGYGWDSDDPVHFAYFTRAEWAQILGQVEVGSNLVGNFAPDGSGTAIGITPNPYTPPPATPVSPVPTGSVSVGGNLRPATIPIEPTSVISVGSRGIVINPPPPPVGSQSAGNIPSRSGSPYISPPESISSITRDSSRGGIRVTERGVSRSDF